MEFGYYYRILDQSKNTAQLTMQPSGLVWVDPLIHIHVQGIKIRSKLWFKLTFGLSLSIAIHFELTFTI